MTAAEAMVWRALRGRSLIGLKSRRQMPIGPYAADFLCRDPRVIFEIDGSSHADAEQAFRDRERGAWLEQRGYRVIRFSNDLALVGTEILTQRLETELKSGGKSPDRAA